MSLDRFVRPWVGSAFRHLPAGSPVDVLDFRFAGRNKENRWNDYGDPTLYLAGDEGVLITEWGRHFADSRTEGVGHMAQHRSVFRLTLALDASLDLRDPEVCAALSVGVAPHRFASAAVARATAQLIRRNSAAQAVLVPPMAFLDQPDRWCLVLFLEKLPAETGRWVTNVAPVGPLRWG